MKNIIIILVTFAAVGCGGYNEKKAPEAEQPVSAPTYGKEDLKK